MPATPGLGNHHLPEDDKLGRKIPRFGLAERPVSAARLFALVVRWPRRQRIDLGVGCRIVRMP